MFRLVVIAAALVCAMGAPRTLLQRPRYPLGSRIVGGTEVPITQIPYQLSFEEGGSHICGASIISPDWAVTAAHCADGASASRVVMRSGSADRGQGISHQATEVIVNEQYDYFNIDFDIALVKVSPAFDVNSASSKAIVLADKAPSAGDTAFVSGWGTTSSGSPSLPSKVRGVEVPIVAWAECNDSYEDYGGITQRMICAGLPQGGKDSCQGDSGGPLAVNNVLAGIVSWGVGCASPGYPGVYSDVASMRAWVKENSGV